LVVCLLAGFALAGCGNDEIVINSFSPDVIAATAPDTLAAGEPLDVKIHWRPTSTCQSLDDFGFSVVDDTTLQIVAQGKETIDPNHPCSGSDAVLEASYRIPNPPSGRFRIQVFGARQLFQLAILGGVTPVAGERHSILVMNTADGQPVPGATAKVVALDTSDTLLVLTTGVDGAADSTLACGVSPRAYKLMVTGSSGRAVTLPFEQNPMRCGVPERTQTRF
jgi:hypothetical protein